MSRNIGVDLTPLRVSKQYRRLYIAGFVTALGSQATYVAVPYQLRLLTHSTLDVGSIGLAELLPLIVFGLYGGVLADRLNRRRLIISMEQVLMISTAVLFVNALLPHPQAWILYVDAFVASGAGSLQRPSIEALNQMFVPTICNVRRRPSRTFAPRRRRSSVRHSGDSPPSTFGAGSVYLANLVTFSFSLILALLASRDGGECARRRGDVAALRSGLRYAMSRPDIVGTYIIDLLAMILAFPVVMLPFVAARFHETYALSLLYCGLPAGALIATLTSGWSRGVHRYGRAIVFAAALWGLGIALFGYSSSLVAGLPRTRRRRRRGRDQWHLSHHDVERIDSAGDARSDGRYRDDLVLARTDRRSVPRRRDGGVDDTALLLDLRRTGVHRFGRRRRARAAAAVEL